MTWATSMRSRFNIDLLASLVLTVSSHEEDMRKDLFNEKAQPAKWVSEGFNRGMFRLQIGFSHVAFVVLNCKLPSYVGFSFVSMSTIAHIRACRLIAAGPLRTRLLCFKTHALQ